MKVLEKGRPQKGWAKKFECTGEGNDGGGCGAQLLVEESDLLAVYSYARDEKTEYLQFECPECSVKTDIWDSDTDACPVPHETLLRIQERCKEKKEERSKQRTKLAKAVQPVDEEVFEELCTVGPRMGSKDRRPENMQRVRDRLRDRLEDGFARLAECQGVYTGETHGEKFASQQDAWSESNTDIIKIVMDLAVSLGCDVDLLTEDEPGNRHIEISRTARTL